MTQTDAALTVLNVNPQTRAADPTRSAWVSANAGSGKTRTLISRVARLLLGNPDQDPQEPRPERILCLTYTKAAAAEMQNRLFETLGEWALMGDAELLAALSELLGSESDPARPQNLPAARRLFAQALETPGGLKIQTIHAFCERLLRRFPVEAGVSPRFKAMDDAQSAALRQLAREQALTDLLRDAPDAAARVVALLTDSKLEDLAEGLLERRASLEAACHPGRARAVMGLSEAPDAADSLIQTLLTGPMAVETRALRDALLDSPASSDAKSGQALVQATDESADASMRLAALRGFAFTAKGEPRAESRFPTKQCPGDRDRWRRVIDQLTHDLQTLDALNRADDSSAILHLAQRFYAAYDAAKAARNVLDFSDLVLRARDLLTRSEAAAWALYKLDNGVDHILVDEAQDTSPEQWDVICALADEFFAGEGARDLTRTIFAVGDEKQSIYSFQGAAPEKFAQMKARFADRLGGALFDTPMRTSYRSTSQILSLVDRVFQGVAAEGLGGAVVHAAHRKTAPGRVDLWPVVLPEPTEEERPWWEPLDQPAPRDPEQILAQTIAEEIARWLKDGEHIPAKGRAVQAGDILILVRRRNTFYIALANELKRRGVPLAGRDRLKLNEELVVKDALALCAFCLLPEDDLTLATVLRSPFIDLPEEALFDLAYGRGRGATLWSALLDKRGDREDFKAAHGVLSDMLDQADFLRPYEFLQRALITHNGRRRLLTRLGIEAEDPLDELLSQALAFEQTGAPALQLFVSHIQTGDVEIKRELDTQGDAVRIMTTHGAKGLEANVVILPDTCAEPRANDQAVWPVGEGALYAPNGPAHTPDTQAAKDAAVAADLAEYRRLLYVAMTRARDWLIVCGYAGTKGPKDDCWHNLVSAAFDNGGAFDTPLRGADGQPVKGKRIEEPGTPDGDSQIKTAPKPDAARFDWPMAPQEAGPVATTKPSEGALRNAAAAIRGDMIHAALEAIHEAPAANTADEAQIAKIATAAARRINPSADAATLEDIAAIASRACALPEAEWVFSSAALAEVPVSGAGVNGIIDRLWIGDGELRVVDFKSGAAKTSAPEAYARQLTRYAAALGQSYPGWRIRLYLLWVDAGRLDEVPLMEDDSPSADAP